MLKLLRLASMFVSTLAWVLFLLSFFLPATNTLQMPGTLAGTPLTGWQAFTSSLLAGASNPWVFLFEPRVFLVLVYPLANCLMLLAPLLVWLLRKKAGALAFLLVPSVFPIWLLPHSLTGDLFVGFYLWQASFIGMSLGCILASFGFEVISDYNDGVRPQTANCHG